MGPTSIPHANNIRANYIRHIRFSLITCISGNSVLTWFNSSVNTKIPRPIHHISRRHSFKRLQYIRIKHKNHPGSREHGTGDYPKQRKYIQRIIYKNGNYSTFASGWKSPGGGYWPQNIFNFQREFQRNPSQTFPLLVSKKSRAPSRRKAPLADGKNSCSPNFYTNYL